MGAKQAAHACVLSHTNAGRVVAVCGCGWIGMVHTPRWTHDGTPAVWWRDVAGAEQAAVAEHAAHAGDAARASAFVANDRILATVRRPGRWSHS